MEISPLLALLSSTKRGSLTLNSESEFNSENHLIFLIRTAALLFFISQLCFFHLGKIRDSGKNNRHFKTSYLPNGADNRETDDTHVISSRFCPNKVSSEKCADARGRS